MEGITTRPIAQNSVGPKSTRSVAPAPEATDSASAARGEDPRDRIERSADLQAHLREIRAKLDQDLEMTSDRIADLRREIQESRERSHELFSKAALEILRPMQTEAELGAD